MRLDEIYKIAVQAGRDADPRGAARIEKESAELKVIERFLPAGLPAAELEALVDAAIAESGAASMKDIGKVMKAVLPKVAGRADGAEINKLVRAKLPA